MSNSESLAKNLMKQVAARFKHEGFGIYHNTKFAIDTGSPLGSIISYEQAILMKIPFDQLRKRDKPITIGGVEAEAFAVEDGELIMRTTTGNLHSILLSPIWVLGSPISAVSKLPVQGILGDDFISRFTLVLVSESHGGRIYFTDERVSSVTSN